MVEGTLALPPAIVLAAGESRRFQPLSADRHKSMFRLGGAPILDRTLDSLAAAGVDEVIIVQSPRSHFEQPEKAELPSDRYGDRANLRAHFVEQPEAVGQGDALLRCASLINGWFFVVQPENVNAGELVAELWNRHSDGDLAVVAGQARHDFKLFAVLDAQGERLGGIREKPQTAQSDAPLCSMGVYLFHTDFLSVLEATQPGPLSIIDAIDSVASLDRAAAVPMSHPFYPLKFPEHLWIFADLFGIRTSGAGADFSGGQAPPGTLPPGISASAVLERCIVSANCQIQNGVRLQRTILDEDVSIGLGSHTLVGPPEPNDRAIEPAVVVGRRATIGRNVGLRPGVRVGVDAQIGDSVEVLDDVPARSKLG